MAETVFTDLLLLCKPRKEDLAAAGPSTAGAASCCARARSVAEVAEDALMASLEDVGLDEDVNLLVVESR